MVLADIECIVIDSWNVYWVVVLLEALSPVERGDASVWYPSRITHLAGEGSTTESSDRCG